MIPLIFLFAYMVSSVFSISGKETFLHTFILTALLLTAAYCFDPALMTWDVVAALNSIDYKIRNM